MGGHIAGVYARKYQDTLASIVLVCPGGIDAPEVTEFVKKSRKNLEEKKESNALMPHTYEEFVDMIKLVVYHSVDIPQKLIEGYLEMKNHRKHMNQKSKLHGTRCRWKR